jgi:hypothetical protein
VHLRISVLDLPPVSGPLQAQVLRKNPFNLDLHLDGVPPSDHRVISGIIWRGTD